MKRLNFFLSALLVLFFAGFYNITAVVAADESPPPQYGSPIDFLPPSYTVFLPTIVNGRNVPPDDVKIDPLVELISTVVNGQADQVVGVYSTDTLGMPVVQQPIGESAYINNTENTITQFAAAASFGSIGLLAHNTKAGSQFYNLEIGQEVVIVNGDGSHQQLPDRPDPLLPGFRSHEHLQRFY